MIRDAPYLRVAGDLVVTAGRAPAAGLGAGALGVLLLVTTTKEKVSKTEHSNTELCHKETFIIELQHDKTNEITCVHSEDSRLAWTSAQSDHSLCWVHGSFCWFCYAAAH